MLKQVKPSAVVSLLIGQTCAQFGSGYTSTQVPTTNQQAVAQNVIDPIYQNAYDNPYNSVQVPTLQNNGGVTSTVVNDGQQLTPPYNSQAYDAVITPQFSQRQQVSPSTASYQNPVIPNYGDNSASTLTTFNGHQGVVNLPSQSTYQAQTGVSDNPNTNEKYATTQTAYNTDYDPAYGVQSYSHLSPPAHVTNELPQDQHIISGNVHYTNVPNNNLNWHTVPIAIENLNKEARDIVDSVAVYRPSNYKWGDIIPSYSFSQYSCIESVKFYKGQNCQNEWNKDKWSRMQKDFSQGQAPYSKDACLINYDLDFKTPQSGLDYRVYCSIEGVSWTQYQQNTNCRGREIRTFGVRWAHDGDSPCINVDPVTTLGTTFEGFSFKPSRPAVATDVEYLRNVYEAERFVHLNDFRNRADSCLVKDWEVYLDRACTIPARAADENIEAAMDVANTVATHATNRCGVVGHLYPFSAPFAIVRCDASSWSGTIYNDYRCTQQRGASFAYKWGQCIEYPFQSDVGRRFIRLYNTEQKKKEDEDVVVQSVASAAPTPQDEEQAKDVEADVVYALSAVFMVFGIVIAGLGCCVFNMKSPDYVQLPQKSGYEGGEQEMSTKAGQNTVNERIESQSEE